MSDLISRQAAIDVADAVWSVTGDKNVAKVWDQLKDLPPVQPDHIADSDKKVSISCNYENDLISRQAAIDAVFNNAEHPDKAYGAIRHLPSAQPEYRFDEWCTDCKEYDTEKHCCPRFNQVIRTTLDEMKSERKKGKWKDFCGSYQCPHCNMTNAYEDNFCPNCGADMRGGQDE